MAHYVVGEIKQKNDQKFFIVNSSAVNYKDQSLETVLEETITKVDDQSVVMTPEELSNIFKETKIEEDEVE